MKASTARKMTNNYQGTPTQEAYDAYNLAYVLFNIAREASLGSFFLELTPNIQENRNADTYVDDKLKELGYIVNYNANGEKMINWF